jgi:predicted aspartyl protease
VRAYIDTGCRIVTIRQTVAEDLHLSIRPTSLNIGVYAGGVTRARGTVSVTLTVDLITAEAEAVVVEDSVQLVPVIVGQSFLNRANVTLVLQTNQIRLFDKNLAELPEVDNHLERPLCGPKTR